MYTPSLPQLEDKICSAIFELRDYENCTSRNHGVSDTFYKLPLKHGKNYESKQ